MRTDPAKIAKRKPVYCPTCNRELPRIGRQPINEDMQLVWADMIYIERRLLAGMMLWHINGHAYDIWAPDEAAQLANMKYRQVHNAIRRLAITGWIKRLGRGRYRLTELAVDTIDPMITSPRMTLAKLQDAQEAKGDQSL